MDDLNQYILQMHKVQFLQELFSCIAILLQLDEVLTDEENTDAVIEFTEELATTFESDSVMSEQDIYQSSKLLANVAKAKPNNASSAKAIIKVGFYSFTFYFHTLTLYHTFPTFNNSKKEAFENIDGKGENAGYQHFLLFLQ